MWMLGRIFEIREFTLQDGPGPRTTVFLQGCPLRCTWCHNPEGEEFGDGREMTDAEVADEVLRTADFLVMSGGGVTLSGGEPLAQSDFSAAIIDRIRATEPRLTYAIETSGFASIADYRKVVQRLDFVYQDIKFPDLDGYRRWTGVDAAPIFENIKWLRKSMVPFVVRVPCIPGVNDSREAKSAIVQIVDGAPNFRGVEFLPYNRLAGAKYAKLGRAYSPGFDESREPDVSIVV